MKKVLTFIISTALIFTMIISVNAVSYIIPGSGGAPVVLGFYIDESKTNTRDFTQLDLRVNWDFGIPSHKESGLLNAESGIENSEIKTYEDSAKGKISFSFKSDKGQSLKESVPFLKMTFSSAASYRNANIQYYVVGDFLGIDGENYADKNIITTKLEKADSIDENLYPTQGLVSHYNVEELTAVVSETPIENSTTPEQTATESSEKDKKTNPVKVTAKTTSVKAKTLKAKKQTVKALTISKAQGKVTIALVKSGTTKAIRNKVTVSNKGVITLKKGKYNKATYNVKVKITAKGNSKYKSKTVTKTVKIKIK